MNGIGWLFLFMNGFEDKSVLATLRGQQKSLAHTEKCVEPLTPLTVEQIVAVREFFELIAKWDEEKSAHGN
jgi:hypothetical protein